MTTKLPFNVSYPILTEHWTYFRMGIISSYPQLYSWELTHNNHLQMDPAFYCSIEDSPNMMHTINYYDEVLQTDEIKACGDIITQIIQSINQSKYVILDCDYDLFEKYTSMRGLHSHLIYGYDDEKKCFISPMLDKSRTFSLETEISYIDLVEAVNNVRALYSEKIDDLFSRRSRNYPFTTIKVNENYNKSFDLNLFFSDMYIYFMGDEYIIGRNNNRELKIYKNLSIYSGIMQFIDLIINNAQNDEIQYAHIQNIMQKIYESECLFKEKLLHISRNGYIKINESVFCNLDCLINKLKQNVMISIKYNMTNDKRKLIAISSSMKDIQDLKRELLQTLIENIKTILLKNYFND